MRAPVAVACNRIISAESDTRLEGGGGRGCFPDLLLLEKDPFTSPLGIECYNKSSMCVCTRINAQLSFGNSSSRSSRSSDAYIQHGSKTEQTTLKREERGGAGSGKLYNYYL